MDLKVEKVGECLVVVSHACDSNGYPVVSINGLQDRAYRHVFREIYGEIFNNEVVRHTCDNRLCVNPEHLVKGSHGDNVRDRVERNRSATGERNGRSKLKNEEVSNIFNDNITPKMQLAARYGVDPKVIRDIQQKKTWRNITG